MTQITLFGERGEEWERITGRRTFPVQSPIPCIAESLPGREGPQRVYLLDIEALDIQTAKRIVNHLCAKFGLTGPEAAEELSKGIPILAEDCVVATTPRWG